MVKRRVSGTGKPISKLKKVVAKPKLEEVTAEPVKTAPDYGSCKTCNSKLVKLLIDSRATVPEYAIVCNNKNCPQYRIVVARE